MLPSHTLVSDVVLMQLSWAVEVTIDSRKQGSYPIFNSLTLRECKGALSIDLFKSPKAGRFVKNLERGHWIKPWFDQHMLLLSLKAQWGVYRQLTVHARWICIHQKRWGKVWCQSVIRQLDLSIKAYKGHQMILQVLNNGVLLLCHGYEAEWLSDGLCGVEYSLFVESLEMHGWE